MNIPSIFTRKVSFALAAASVFSTLSFVAPAPAAASEMDRTCYYQVTTTTTRDRLTGIILEQTIERTLLYCEG